MLQPDVDPAHPVTRALEDNEVVHHFAATGDYSLVLTDRRLAVEMGQRLSLNVPYHGLRRVQFDLERGRPATLVLVPDRPSDEPHVLAVPFEHYEDVGSAVLEIGRRIYGPPRR